MNIRGPFRNKRRGNWYLSYFVPKLGPNGAAVLTSDGKVVLDRHRPHYDSKDLAAADKPRILAQFGAGGGGDFVHSRTAQEDYERARKLLPPGVTVAMAAQFYLKHNPTGEAVTLEKAREDFLAHHKLLVGDKSRGYKDYSWRTKAFVAKFPGRLAASIVRTEAIDYLLRVEGGARSKLNHKRALCRWGNWMLKRGIRTDNPFGGIKRDELPKVLAKEVEFLPLESAEAYLRACERYDPELVAHEAIQFFAGVRADDEMASFRGEWVKCETREVVTPAEMTKTGVREVINGLEENFWAWWKAYGRETGLLRPTNCKKRLWRIRILSQIADHKQADALAGMWIDKLLRQPFSKSLLDKWPWNARRRTFCTHHVAKHESAAKTALILRHRGDPETLHNCYRGLGVTKRQGEKYFELMPDKVAAPIRPPQLQRKVAPLSEKS